GIAAASVVLYGAGAWLGYPELVVLAAGGVLATMAAVLWTLPRPRLTVRRDISPVRVERGAESTGVLHVTNTGRTKQAGLRARDTCGHGTIDIEMPRLRPGAVESVRYPLPTGRRGQIAVGPLRLVRADPLGLASRVREYGEPRTLLVWPRTVGLPALPSGRS